LLTACILFSDPAASEAAFLVTGDKALLALKRHGATRIVTPAAMLEWLKTPDAPATESP
jgi:predicted nucleic acid-binding protein